MEYKGYIKVAELNYGEVALGPKESIKDWMHDLEESVGSGKVEFESLELDEKDRRSINNFIRREKNAL